MMRFLLSVFLLASASAAHAQPVVEGRVTAEGAPVALATVRVAGTVLGTAADAEGRYRLELPAAGPHTIVFSAIGFATAERRVTAGEGEAVRLDVALQAATYEAGAVVVTGTLQQIAVRESPVKVEVLPEHFLQAIPTSNVMDVVERVNGLYQQIDCGVCYTNNIRINGIEGPNTAVLIDGMPVMSSLATVYGLNGISPMLIKQVEVVKGPMSTLYGSEALGGVVNIITKAPATAPGVSTHAFSTSHAEMAAEVAVAPLRGRTGLLLSGTLFHVSNFHDDNGDGFSDRPFQTQLAGFAKLTHADRQGFERGSLAAKLYYEDRAAGVAAFLDDPAGLRGSDRVYGESIYTRRAEVLGAWRLRRALRLEGAASAHGQDSYYGDAAYDASQVDAFGQLLWTPETDGTRLERHRPLLGLALRAQRYDDGSAATGRYDDAGRLLQNRPDVRVVPGVFVQDDWTLHPSFRLLTGLRADLQPDFGVIASPRGALKWSPTEATTARLNVGTGFRIVNLFTEDHAAYTGGRATLVLEDLRPERSVSAAAALQTIVPLGNTLLTLDLDAFHTRFSNKIEPDYATPGEIRYRNLDGSATTRGLAAQVQGTLGRGARFTVGATLLDVYAEEAGRRRALEFAPSFQGTATLTADAPGGFVVDYTARLTGPMRLPDYDDATRAAYRAATGADLYARSPTYTVHNVQVTKDFALPGGRLLQAYAAVENALDYRQSSPLVGYYDGTPGFGDSFDTAYVYGPIEGRHVGLGLRLTMP